MVAEIDRIKALVRQQGLTLVEDQPAISNTSQPIRAFLKVYKVEPYDRPQAERTLEASIKAGLGVRGVTDYVEHNSLKPELFELDVLAPIDLTAGPIRITDQAVMEVRKVIRVIEGDNPVITSPEAAPTPTGLVPAQAIIPLKQAPKFREELEIIGVLFVPVNEGPVSQEQLAQTVVETQFPAQSSQQQPDSATWQSNTVPFIGPPRDEDIKRAA